MAFPQLELTDKRLKVRLKRRVPGAIFRVQDVGRPGFSQRVAMFNPKTGRWSTQGWTFPQKAIKEKDKKTKRILTKLGVYRKALKKVM